MSRRMVAGASCPSACGAQNPGDVNARTTGRKRRITKRIRCEIAMKGSKPAHPTRRSRPRRILLLLERSFDAEGPLDAVLVVLTEQPRFVVVVDHRLVEDVASRHEQPHFPAKGVFATDVHHEALLLIARDGGAHNI